MLRQFIVLIVSASLLSVSPAHASDAKDQVCAMALAPPSLESRSARLQILKDLVLENRLFFNEETLNFFVQAYGRVMNESKKYEEYTFSIESAAKNWAAFSPQTRRQIVETTWDKFAESESLGNEITDVSLINFRTHHDVSPNQARKLLERLHGYQTDPAARAQVLSLLEDAFPAFLEAASKMPSLSNKQYDNVLATKFLFGIAASMTAGVTWYFGVPWEHFIDHRGYFALSGYETEAAGLAFYKTHQFAGLAALPITYFTLRALRAAKRRFWVRPKLDRKLKALAGGAALFRPNEIRQFPADAKSDPAFEPTLEQTIENLSLAAKAKLGESLNPAAPEYLASNFADFGDVGVGERNFIASNQLFAIERLVDNRTGLAEIARELRKDLGAGKIKKETQLAYLGPIYDAIVRRQKLLQWAQAHVGTLGRLLSETRDAVTELLAYADGPEMRERRERLLMVERNLLTQTRSLQEQQQASVLLFQALEKIEQRRTLQYLSLGKIASKLTLLNAGREDHSDAAIKADWTALADALEGI